jgi:uncharacterized protein (UPF0335 family)
MPKAKTDDLIEEPGQGHNSFSKNDLLKIITSVETLLEEKSNIGKDIKAAMDVAAEKGFDKRTVREMIKLRALDAEQRTEREQLRDMYLQAIGLMD